MLLDSHAFKQSFGKGCQAPDCKCKKDRYKKLLADAIRETGTQAISGGMEFADDIVNAMDIDEMLKRKETLALFIQDLQEKFRK